jgi:hypothetical protein
LGGGGGNTALRVIVLGLIDNLLNLFSVRLISANLKV